MLLLVSARKISRYTQHLKNSPPTQAISGLTLPAFGCSSRSQGASLDPAFGCSFRFQGPFSGLLRDPIGSAWHWEITVQ